MSVYLSFCVSALCISLRFRPFAYSLSTYPAVYLSNCLSMFLSVYLFVIRLFGALPIYPFPCRLPACLSACLSCFSSHLSVYPPISYPFACPSISTIYLSDSLSFHLDSLTACSCHAHTKHTVLLANSRDMWKCNWDTVKSEAFLRDLLTF